MSDNLGICPVCQDVETLHGEICWRCREQEQIDNDPNPPGGVDWDHICPTCHWYLARSGACVNPDCMESYPDKMDSADLGYWQD